MFKRLILEDWQSLAPLIAFAATFLVFLFFAVRALLMKQAQVKHMAHLPMEKDTPPTHSRHKQL